MKYDAPSYSVLAQIAKHLQRDVDEAIIARARLHLLDWLACVAGARATAAHRVGQALGEPMAAAAMLGNVMEMDDVHRTALLHPGPVVWPAALATGDDLNAALTHAVRGYEAMVRVGAMLDARHYAHWHPTATAGLAGAAAASASALGLDEARTMHALANALSVAGGFWHMRHDDVLTKQWHVLHAVEAGARAAHLAGAGLTGPAAILEGPQGLFAAMTDAPKPLLFTDGWAINEVSFKPWAACRHAHPAIDAALTLRARGDLRAPFLVETYADAIAFCDRSDPKTELEAKFSLQHALAVIADGRGATPSDFTAEAIAALAPLRAQVTVREDTAITTRYPAHFGARVNGHEVVDTLGDPERPVEATQIAAKMAMLAEWGGLGAAEAGRACDLALHGDSAADVRKMLTEWLT